MYRPSFPHVTSMNQVDIQMSSKTLTPAHMLQIHPPTSQKSPLPVTPTLCEDGHPYVTDPATGRKLCTCNLGTEVSFDHRSLMSDARKQGMSFSGTFGSPIGLETSAFYSPLIRGMPVRQDMLPPYLTSGISGQPMPFDPALASHPYGLLYAGLDVNGGPIRKAATRETTGPLKVWLSEHKKNPYPTKAEKIMLAIITRMTLTQVSTWFANARRRLKKENKLYPSDRDNREHDDDDDDEFNDNRDGNTSQSAGSEKRTLSESDTEDINVDLSDYSDNEEDILQTSSAISLGQDHLAKSQLDAQYDPSRTDILYSGSCTQENEHDKQKQYQTSHVAPLTMSPDSPRTSSKDSSFRPKIWSISEIIKGPSGSKDSCNQTSRTFHSPPGLTTSNHLVLSSSSSTRRQVGPTFSMTNSLSSLSSFSFSSTIPSSLSPALESSLQPVVSMTETSSYRLEMPRLASSYSLPITAHTLHCDRNLSLTTNHSSMTDRAPGTDTKDTHIETKPSFHKDDEEDKTEQINKSKDKTETNGRSENDSKLKSQRSSAHPMSSNCQQANYSNTKPLPSVSQKTAVSSHPLTSPYKTKSDHPGHRVHKSTDVSDGETVVGQAYS